MLIKSLSPRVRVTGLTYAFTLGEMNNPQIKQIRLCGEAATIYGSIKRAERHGLIRPTSPSSSGKQTSQPRIRRCQQIELFAGNLQKRANLKRRSGIFSASSTPPHNPTERRFDSLRLTLLLHHDSGVIRRAWPFLSYHVQKEQTEKHGLRHLLAVCSRGERT